MFQVHIMVEFVAVVGCQRSGTTLMGQILGAHPEAVLIDENDGLYAWTDALFGRSSELDHRDLLKRCFRAAMTKYRAPGDRFDKDGQPLNHIKFAVLKAPNLTYCYERMVGAMPTSKIIYMVRDIRDVVASVMSLEHVPILKNQLRFISSHRDLARLFPNEITFLNQSCEPTQEWIKMAVVAKIKMSLTGQFKEQGYDVIDVKYEDLVSRSAMVIPDVLDRLGLPAAEECLHHNDVLHGVGPGKTQRSRPIDPHSIGKWRQTMSCEQANRVWENVGTFLERLGYRQ